MKQVIAWATPLVMIAAFPLVAVVAVAAAMGQSMRCPIPQTYNANYTASLATASSTSNPDEDKQHEDDHDHDGDQATAPPTGEDVLDQLMRVRLTAGGPQLTKEQATNALTIATVSRELDIPRRGLVVALATSIQESTLVNLPGGDRDSAGLFQQRPSAGWGSLAQVTDPALATRAFYGRADHTKNPGLLDVNRWQDLSVTAAAQKVQRSGTPDAYAKWQPVAEELADILGKGLPTSDTGWNVECAGDPTTYATLNILGSSHTEPGKNAKQPGKKTWDKRLPQTISLLEQSGASIAGLQEVHPPQSKAMTTTYADRWGMYPTTSVQNKVVWDRSLWTLTDTRSQTIPYLGNREAEIAVAQLTSTSTGQSVWVISIHNSVDSRSDRLEALRRELALIKELKASGLPVVILGDFNDGKKDGDKASHCTLTPTVTNAFGGTTNPCRKGDGDASIDHIYGTNLDWAAAHVDRSTIEMNISDHPLVVATTIGDDDTTCPATGSAAEKGLTPDALLVLRSIDARFGSHHYGGVRPNAQDHTTGRAVDTMIDQWDSKSGIKHGDQIANWVRENAEQLGVTYIIWRKRIWSSGDKDWRPYKLPPGRSGATWEHRDHVHVSVAGTRGTLHCGPGAGSYANPVAPALMRQDRHNWHAGGSRWKSWHTGTDFSGACGSPVYAAQSGTVQVDTNQPWAGTWLVKVTAGPGKLTTWYAHMQSLRVTRGQKVQAGQQIGTIGARGNASGCHLHFEVHLKGGSIYGPDNVNPSKWLAQHVTPAAST